MSITEARHPDVIIELMQQAVAARDVPTAVTPILEHLVSRTAAEGAAYFQQNGAVHTARAASGIMPEGEMMAAILAHGLPNETPLIGTLKQRTNPIFFNDTSIEDAAVGFPELGVISLAAAPVRDANGGFVGAFLMHTFQPHTWEPDESSLFAAMAGTLAHMTARLVAEEQTIQAREGALRALGMALEQRDGETHGHTDRVMQLAQMIGHEMNVDQNMTVILRWGAYLHDIGKVAIPDAVLLKPGKLDDDEWTIMRNHSEAGYQFALQLGFLPDDTLSLIRHHHERWDGVGYPHGLDGPDIPLAARIFAVCDVYDALISQRPYKQAWTHDEAVTEIVSQSGKQFDPDVINAFQRITPMLIAAQN